MAVAGRADVSVSESVEFRIETGVVSPGTLLVPLASVIFTTCPVCLIVLVVTESMLVDAVLAEVVLMVPGLGKFVEINVVWLRACVAVVAEWGVVSCVVLVVVGGNRDWVVETGVSVAVVIEKVVYVELRVPVVVLPVERLFVIEGVVTGTVSLVLVALVPIGERVVVIRTVVPVLVSVIVVGKGVVVIGKAVLVLALVVFVEKGVVLSVIGCLEVTSVAFVG